jgi:hypothetical protein
VTINDKVQDIILVLNQLVKRQYQQGVRLPDGIDESMKRLADSLLSEAEHSARRLEDLKSQRGRLISKRGELDLLRRQQQWLLENPKGQPADLLARTKQNSVRTVAEYDSCIRRLDAIEAEIAAFAKAA